MDIDDLDIDFKPINRGLGLHQKPKTMGLSEKPLRHEPRKVQEIVRSPAKTDEMRDYIKKASLMERLEAFAIDVLITSILFTFFIIVAGAFCFYFEGRFFSIKNIIELKIEFLALFALVYIIYFAYLEGFSGQTIGKKWCHLEVFWTKKEFLFLKVLLRVATSPLFYLYASEREYLQDKLSNSKVVKINAV